MGMGITRYLRTLGYAKRADWEAKQYLKEAAIANRQGNSKRASNMANHALSKKQLAESYRAQARGSKRG